MTRRGAPTVAAVLSVEALSTLIEAFAGKRPPRSLAEALLDRVAIDVGGLTDVVRHLVADDPEPLTSLRNLASAGRPERNGQPVADLFRREGDYWTIGYRGEVVRLHDAKGLQYLARLLGRPGTRIRATDLAARSDAGRARLSVTKAIKGALERLRAAHPALGAHLSATVRTGGTCVYLPDPDRPIRWRT